MTCLAARNGNYASIEVATVVDGMKIIDDGYANDA